MTEYLRNMIIGVSLVTMALAGCGNGAKVETTTAKQEEVRAGMAAAQTSEKETSVDQSGSQTEGTTGGTEEGEKKAYKFGFAEWAAGSFFNTYYDGVMEVVNKKGGEVIRVEGKTGSNYRLGVIGDSVAQDVDCVFYNPADTEATGSALKLLQEADIPVVNSSLATADLDMMAAFVTTDHCSAGKVAGESMIKDHPEGGKIAILDRTNNNAAAQRIQDLSDTIEGEGFEMAAKLDAGGKPETGLSTTEDILQANSDLVATCCTNDECTQGTYSAVEAPSEKVGIYSADGGPESKAAIKKDGADDIWKMSAAQSPFTTGKEDAEVVYKILEGENYEKETLVLAFAIDATNIDQYAGSDWRQNPQLIRRGGSSYGHFIGNEKYQ